MEQVVAQAMERQGGRVRRIDEIRERLDKARPGLGEIDGGEELLKRRGNPKGSYTWTLYGTYADAILLVNARNDIAWLLDALARRDQRCEEHQEPPNADDPTDAEVRAAAEEAEYHEQWVYDEDGFPHCECGASLVESEHDLGVVPSLMAHQVRAALLAARKVSGR